ncbi:hypothetical protein [Helicobacter bizzozeronii]|uniref:hypothetical protein n=1 Tax=Helicobacter bizzozeronii TaxID=56877 RepID=UPI000CEF21BA|nr:hypothetical protein [Helicobacter bizzozeronii]
MLVFGHPKIPCMPFKCVADIQAIAQVPSHTIPFFQTCHTDAFGLSKHCSDQGVKYAIWVQNPLECALMANFKPAYILAENQLEECQSIANDYLLDARILKVIEHAEQLEEVLKLRLDGAVFRSFLWL